MDLRAYLTQHGLDNEKFAAQLGVTKEAVRLWLSGERIPRPAMMRRIENETRGLVTPTDLVPAFEGGTRQ